MAKEDASIASREEFLAKFDAASSRVAKAEAELKAAKRALKAVQDARVRELNVGLPF